MVMSVNFPNKLEVPRKKADNTFMENEIESGVRYVVEKGGVCNDERVYLRLGRYSDGAGYSKWSDLRNATQFITEYGARKCAEQSGLDGLKVIIKCYQYDEYCDTYNKKEQIWECQGSV